MAMTVNSRTPGVNVRGKRTATFDLTFSDGAAADLTALVSGLTHVDDVYIKAKTTGGTGIDVTTNDGVKVTLDPVAAISNVIVVLVGSE